jgi:hypothetical protein
VGGPAGYGNKERLGAFPPFLLFGEIWGPIRQFLGPSQRSSCDGVSTNNFRIIEEDEESLVGDCQDGNPEGFRYHFGTLPTGTTGHWSGIWWTVDDSYFVRALTRAAFPERHLPTCPITYTAPMPRAK